jgi:hypothetical protein
MNPEARHIDRWHMKLHTRLHLDCSAARIPAQMPQAARQTPGSLLLKNGNFRRKA